MVGKKSYKSFENIEGQVVTDLKDLFVKPDCNIVNELDGPTEPSLF